MNKLSKDLLEKIGGKLDAHNYLNLREVVKNKLDTNDVWRRRFEQEPFNFLYPYLKNASKKNIGVTFVELHDIIQQTAIKNTQKVMNWLGKFTRFLNSSYERELTDFFYSSFINSLKYVLSIWESSGMADIHDVFITESLGETDIYNKIIMSDFLPFTDQYKEDLKDTFHDLVVDDVTSSMSDIFIKYLNIPYVDSDDEVINELEKDELEKNTRDTKGSKERRNNGRRKEKYVDDSDDEDVMNVAVTDTHGLYRETRFGWMIRQIENGDLIMDRYLTEQELGRPLTDSEVALVMQQGLQIQ